MLRTNRKAKWKTCFMVVWACFSLFFLTATVFVCREWKKSLYEKQLLEEKLNSMSHMVYVAAEKLPGGTVLTEEKVNMEMKYYDLENTNLITESAFGATLSADVEEGTCLNAWMLCREEQNGREIFLTDISFTEYVQKGARIDVRIRYNNAEDYTVLADKTVKGCNAGNGMVLELTEEEILHISSAFADMEKYDGTTLYVAKYPDYETTLPGVVNYIPNREILMLLGREKTQGENRTAMELRLMQK